MPFDSGVFRNALARFPSGICVVTTVDADGKPWGFTATAFSSLSLEPPLVLVCLDRRADSHTPFSTADRYGVSVLAREQLPLAMRFATKEIDKFEAVEVMHGAELGIPLIPGAVVHLECRMHRTIPVGDHTILIGEVINASLTEAEPILHYNRQYGIFHQPEVS